MDPTTEPHSSLSLLGEKTNATNTDKVTVWLLGFSIRQRRSQETPKLSDKMSLNLTDSDSAGHRGQSPHFFMTSHSSYTVVHLATSVVMIPAFLKNIDIR